MFKHQIDNEVVIKLLEPRHSEELFNLTEQSKSYLREWLPWIDYNKSVDETKSFIESSLKQFGNNDGFQAGIWYKDQLAGVIGLHSISWSNKSTTIGYWLGESFQGKGIMTKACKALIEYVHNELDINRIEIRVATENNKSKAIPERLGFKNEGHLRKVEWLYDKYVDHYVFGLVKEE